MKSVKILTLSAAVLCGASAAWAEAPNLKVYHDDEARDTVYTAKYYSIGVTTPGAKATIDGKECHVYKTGSFGAEIQLKPGLNEIPFTATLGSETATAVDRVFYETNRKAPAAKRTETTPLKWPKHLLTKEYAYLQFGNGADRLGGSKMNYLPADVPLTAVGETSNLYQVMLGENDFAYVPKSSVTEGGPGAATVNTGSTSVTNTGKTDRIVVSLPQRLPFYTRSEIDPSTILVTLYGATNNTNWLTQLNTPGMIDFVDLRRDGADELTLVIRLKDEFQWGWSVDYEGNNLVIEVRHRPKSLNIKDLTIGLDAGHGGKYPGAVSPSGLTEKEVNLDIVLKAADMLRKMGAKVVLTRDSDQGPSMTERKKTWLEGGVDLAVSVHNNASGNPLIPMGNSCYYKHISNRALANALHQSMLKMKLADFGLTGNFNFSLNGPTEYPNALVEVLFMSSLPEEELLADPAYRTRLARGVVDGILDYLAQVRKSVK